MKRRNAILLGSAFLLALAGYVAWCWRAFYQWRTIIYQKDIPPEVVEQSEHWRRSNPEIFEPEPASFSDAITALMYPYQIDDYQMEATLDPMRPVIYLKNRGACHPHAYFEKESGEWKGYDTSGKPLDPGPSSDPLPFANPHLK